MKPFNILKAKLHKVPYEIIKHWPPFYIMYRDEKIGGCWVLDFDVHREVGDVVSLLIRDDTIYKYKIVKITKAPGDDHIMPSKQFDLIYRGKNDEQ